MLSTVGVKLQLQKNKINESSLHSNHVTRLLIAEEALISVQLCVIDHFYPMTAEHFFHVKISFLYLHYIIDL